MILQLGLASYCAPNDADRQRPFQSTTDVTGQYGAVAKRCTSSMTAPTTSSVDGSTMAPTKARGRFLLRDLAPSVPIFGDPVLVPDHDACHPGITRQPRAEARVHLTLL
jgi:hypothetical protein